MKSTFAVRVSVAVVVFLLAVTSMVTVVHVGKAHAYSSVADYYDSWSKYGVVYPGSTVITPSPSIPPTVPGTDGSDTAITQTVPLPPTSTASDYFSRLRNSTYVWKPPVTPPPVIPPPVTPPPVTPPSDPGNTSSLSPGEKQMFDLVNKERANAGLHLFTVDPRLVTLARMKSQDMYENNYFSHVSPTYGKAFDMEKKAGVVARVMGAENICKAATVAEAHMLFMNSEGHRANILDSREDYIGIGVVTTQYGVYVTQLFLGD